MSSDRLRLLTVVLDLPIASERFVLRELVALQQLGVALRIVTLRSRGDTAVPELPGLTLLRPPAWSSPRLWLGVLMAALTWPRRSLRLLLTALAAEQGGQGWYRLRALRLTIVALVVARGLRRSPPDLIHAHFASQPATLALLLGQVLARPAGFSLHASDLYAEPIALVRKARQASHLLTCSEVAAEDLRARLPAALAGLVHTVHHGLDLERWRPAGNGQGQAAPPLVLAAGRLVPKKGFHHLVDACAILRDQGLELRCRLLGAGAEEAALRRRIDRLGLAEHLQLVAWQEPAALRRQLHGASMLVMPSIITDDGDRDNIPNVVVEALACGVPVVCSGLPALRRLLEPAGAGVLVEPGNPQALARAISELIADPSRCLQLRRSGRRLAEQRFDQVANARRLLDLLRRSSRAEAVLEEPRQDGQIASPG